MKDAIDKLLMKEGDVYEGTTLTYVKKLGKGNGKRTRHLWRCECGNYTAVYPYNIVKGETKSCGCLHRSLTSNCKYSKRPEYVVLQSIRQHCTNPNNKEYERMNRIPEPIDPRWLYNTKAFFDDVGFRPDGRYFLVRRDKGVGYNKANCFWGTKEDLNVEKDPLNPYGRRPVHTFMGEPMFIREFSRITSLSINSINGRLRRGKTMDQIFGDVCSHG